MFTGCFVIVVSSTLLDCCPFTVATSVKIVRSPLIPSWTTLVCPLGKVASFCVIVSKGTTSVETTTFGLPAFASSNSSTSVGFVVVTSSLVPTAITLFIGCLVIEVLITLLDCLPSTVVTSLNTICSPLTPSWTTLNFPLGKVASGCSTVWKVMASVVDLSSGLFSTTVLIPSSGVVLYSNFVVGCSGRVGSTAGFSGWVGSTFGSVGFGRTFCSTWGKASRSLSVK